MTKSDKIDLVQGLTDSFRSSSAILVCNYKGITVKNLECLRNEAKPLGISMMVIKNTLASIALKNAGYSDVNLKDNNIFAWSHDQINLSKIICKFRDDNPDKFKVKFGYFDGSLVDVDHINKISKLPNREELIGMLLSVWMGPARYFATALDNLRKQKEGE